MSEKIEQLLERQNELLETISNSLVEQQADIKELVKLTHLVIRAQMGFGIGLSENAKAQINQTIKSLYP